MNQNMTHDSDTAELSNTEAEDVAGNTDNDLYQPIPINDIRTMTTEEEDDFLALLSSENGDSRSIDRTKTPPPHATVELGRLSEPGASASSTSSDYATTFVEDLIQDEPEQSVLQLASRLGICVPTTILSPLSSVKGYRENCLPTAEYREVDIVPPETEQDSIARDIELLRREKKWPPKTHKPDKFSEGAMKELRLSKAFPHKQVKQFKKNSNMSKKNICSLCSQRNMDGKRESSFKCDTCEVYLCTKPARESPNERACFDVWHEKDNLVGESELRKKKNAYMYSLRQEENIKKKDNGGCLAAKSTSAPSAAFIARPCVGGTKQQDGHGDNPHVDANVNVQGKSRLAQEESGLLKLLKIIQIRLDKNRLAQGKIMEDGDIRNGTARPTFAVSNVHHNGVATFKTSRPSLPDDDEYVNKKRKSEEMAISSENLPLHNGLDALGVEDRAEDGDADKEEKKKKKKRKKDQDDKGEAKEDKDQTDDEDDNGGDDDGNNGGMDDHMDDSGDDGAGSNKDSANGNGGSSISSGQKPENNEDPSQRFGSKSSDTCTSYNNSGAEINDKGGYEKYQKTPSIHESSSNATENPPKGKDGTHYMHDRLTVFSSAPLVVEHGGAIYPFPLLDFDHERKVLLDSLKEENQIGSDIDVVFEAATTDRIGACLAAGSTRVLHFSTHGHPKYLAIEDGRGAMQPLPIDRLKQFIASGSRSLRVVFVSACHSLAAGQAFVDAGVPHVICCRQNAKLRDKAALEFAQHFYRSLAHGVTLKQSFLFAKNAIMVSPKYDEPRKEMDKFVLLPVKDDDDPYHDVQVFRTQPIQPNVAKDMSGSKLLPPPPQLFLGREVSMFHILQELKIARVVRLTGEQGIGKTALAKAVCKYIQGRMRTFFFEDIIWLPLFQNDNDSLSTYFCQLFALFKSEDSSSGTELANLCGKIVRDLYEKRAIIFIDAEWLSQSSSLENVKTFLKEIIRGTQYIKVVVICPSEKDIYLQELCVDVRVPIEPLCMKSSVLLFGYLCPFVSQQRCPAVHTPNELVDLLVPAFQANATAVDKSMSKRCADIFNIIGRGNPSRIHVAATTMTEDEYFNLIRLGQRPEFHAKIDNRYELENAISTTKGNLDAAVTNSDFIQAQSLSDYLEELENLREKLPSLEELEALESELSLQLHEATTQKSYFAAEDLKKQLNGVKARLSKEKALSSSKEGSIHVKKQIAAQKSSKSAGIKETKHPKTTRKESKSISIINVSSLTVPLHDNDLTEEEATDLKELFCKYGFNCDGTITVSEARQILTEFGQKPRQREWKEIKTTFNDDPSDRKIDFDALVSLIKLRTTDEGNAQDADTQPCQVTGFKAISTMFNGIGIDRGGVKPVCAFSIGSFYVVISMGSVVDFSYPNRTQSGIVTATNEGLLLQPEDGVGGAVGAAAGQGLQGDISKLEKLCQSRWGPILCETGDAKLVGPSNNYGKLNVPYVIFAVGPDYSYVHIQGQDLLKQKDALLRAAYRSSLKLAKKVNLEAISFSLLSAGCRGGRQDRARSLRIGLETMREYSGYHGLKEIHMVGYKAWEVEALIAYAQEMKMKESSSSWSKGAASA